jgi:hypothetical protein
MEKLTDNEIIKALECCKTTLSEIGACKECPLYQGEGHTCITTLSKNALDLIKCQKAEIEDLKKVIETMTNEQLQFGFEAESKIEQAKAEAIKEFAERLKRHCYFDHKDQRNAVAEVIIDHYVKEMVGDAE